MDTAVGILQSDSHPTPRDSEGCGGAERPLQSYLDAQREVVAIQGLEATSPDTQSHGLAPGSPSGGIRTSRYSRRIWLGSRGEQLGYMQWLRGELPKQRPERGLVMLLCVAKQAVVQDSVG